MTIRLIAFFILAITLFQPETRADQPHGGASAINAAENPSPLAEKEDGIPQRHRFIDNDGDGINDLVLDPLQGTKGNNRSSCIGKHPGGQSFEGKNSLHGGGASHARGKR